MMMILGLLVGLLVMGGAVALGVMLAMRSSSGGAQPLAPQPSAPMPPLDPSKVPPKWGWARMRSVPMEVYALGYYYVDPTAGPSFRPVVDLKDGPSDAEIASRAAAAQYRGDTIVRVGGHEWVNAGAMPPDAVAVMVGTRLEDGGPSGTAVVTLSAHERQAFELPEVPSWVGAYLR